MPKYIISRSVKYSDTMSLLYMRCL